MNCDKDSITVFNAMDARINKNGGAVTVTLRLASFSKLSTIENLQGLLVTDGPGNHQEL
jgi:hypothetical protein